MKKSTTSKKTSAKELSTGAVEKSSRTRRAYGAPKVVHMLMRSMHATSETLIDRAYLEAKDIIRQFNDMTHEDREALVGAFVQAEGEEELRRHSPELLKQLARDGCATQNAFQDPAFALGFSLAYLLINESGAR